MLRDEKSLTVLDLFSGIGGFSLGLERAGIRTLAFCEIDPDCRTVLTDHWPAVPVFPDITELSYDFLGIFGAHEPNVLCGGFPCQDISYAKPKADGIAGERSGLWSEFARLIGELRPDYAIIENVPALRSRGLVRVLRDLLAIGYDAEWHIISAAGVGAFHLRERIWIVAYAHGERRAERPLQKLRELFKRSALLRPAEHKITLPLNAGRYPRRALPENLLLDDGLSRRVDRHIRLYGNSIVPRIAEIIGREIIYDNRRRNYNHTAT